MAYKRVGSREPFLIREEANAIKEEQYDGLKLFGGMLIWQRKTDGWEGREAAGWKVRRLF